jgi:hypothetical protein
LVQTPSSPVSALLSKSFHGIRAWRKPAVRPSRSSHQGFRQSFDGITSDLTGNNNMLINRGTITTSGTFSEGIFTTGTGSTLLNGGEVRGRR